MSVFNASTGNVDIFQVDKWRGTRSLPRSETLIENVIEQGLLIEVN